MLHHYYGRGKCNINPEIISKMNIGKRVSSSDCLSIYYEVRRSVYNNVDGTLREVVNVSVGDRVFSSTNIRIWT